MDHFMLIVLSRFGSLISERYHIREKHESREKGKKPKNASGREKGKLNKNLVGARFIAPLFVLRFIALGFLIRLNHL